MSIYEMKNKEITQTMKEFIKTEFGKIVFFQSFCSPFIMTIVCIVATVVGCTRILECALLLVPIMALITILLFIIGHVYYFHELKEFIKEK